jgi:hypothetical protein
LCGVQTAGIVLSLFVLLFFVRGYTLVKGAEWNMREIRSLLIQGRMNLTTIVSPHGTKAHAWFVNGLINGVVWKSMIPCVICQICIWNWVLLQNLGHCKSPPAQRRMQPKKLGEVCPPRPPSFSSFSSLFSSSSP